MDLQTRKEKLDLLNKHLKKKKFMAILLALFTLGVNAFAWFVFSTHSEFEYDGKVAAWDVELREEGSIVNDFIIAVNMKPGMADFSKNYEINNLGEVDAKLSYEIESMKLMGRDVDLSGVADPVAYLQNFYPFSIEVTSDRQIITPQSTAHFSVVISWDFEDSSAYYQLNDIYDFDSSFIYYKKNGNSYESFPVTSSTYSANRSTLYLEKDDADTYFGMQCGAYQDVTNLSCLELKIVLSVEQNNA